MADTLNRSGMLFINQSLKSRNGAYELRMQEDGNLVFRKTGSGTLIWDSNTTETGANRVVLSNDGDLEIYCFNRHNIGDKIWATNTGGLGVSRLVLEDRGSLALQNDQGDTVYLLSLVDRKLARTMAIASDYAYRPLQEKSVPDIGGWKYSVTYPDFFNGEPFAIAYSRRNSDLMIAFRGTGTFSDWWTDAEFLPAVRFVPYDPRAYEKVDRVVGLEEVNVHRGFYLTYSKESDETNLSLRSQVLHFLKQGSGDLYLTGHSLGGALAQLCAYDLMTMVPNLKSRRIHLITFGAPAVGFDAMRKNVARMRTHYRDQLNFHRIFAKGDTIAPLLTEKAGYVYWGFAELDLPDHGHSISLYRKSFSR